MNKLLTGTDNVFIFQRSTFYFDFPYVVATGFYTLGFTMPGCFMLGNTPHI
jgi:hypothetical protein